MNYLPLLKLNINHDYYEDGYCSDFSIEADTATHNVLQNHRCILKRNQNGFIIYQAVDGNGAPFISLSSSTIFRFNLILVNSQYALFTDLSRFSNKASPVFTNEGITNGQLKLISSNSQQGKGYFANIEIHFDDSIKPVKKDPTRFDILFSAKSACWEYFFVTDKDGDNSNYQIKHAESQISEPNENNHSIVFNKETPQPQAILDLLAKQFPKANLFYFVSDKPVRCQQSPRKNIQIIRNGDRLLDNLPNPSLSNANQRMVGEEGNKAVQQTFFHIVKYITHSFSTTGI